MTSSLSLRDAEDMSEPFPEGDAKLAEFYVGQKVVNIDNDNLLIAVGVITVVHGDGEYDIETHWPQIISPILHDGKGSNIYPLSDDLFNYLCHLEKHAMATGFYKDAEAEAEAEDISQTIE